LIHPSDISYSRTYGDSSQLGAPEKGLTTKTGPRQGVRPDRPLVERLLLHYRDEARQAGRHRLFSITPQQFYRAWVAACDALGYHPGPPHSLRHTGASFDALEDWELGCCYRDLGAIRVRGRWKMEASVQRYSKTHVYLRALAEMSPSQQQRGAELYSRLGRRPTVPRL